MYRPKDTQERILHRLKIAQGHLKKVLKMVEGNEYCIDVIHQSQAVQRALEEVDSLVLENHLKTCVVNHIREGKVKTTTDEIMKVFKRVQ
ncbi:metal-sensitive transcriptional regulator [Candidatus Microgenomates bacterium]|nr:metal-sensitive transcriptional regulator [Candidatus Microgenomates bacterium]